MKALVFTLCLFSLFSCQSQVTMNETARPSSDDPACKYYRFNNQVIDLQSLTALRIDPSSGSDFKTCSKYARRFSNPIGDSVTVAGKTFAVVNDKKSKTYRLDLLENGKLIRKVEVPVQNPLPEVHEYYMSLIPFKNSVILLMHDMYTTHYQLVRYDSAGNELLTTEIEHTYVTHEEPNTDHHHRYLYFGGMTHSQLIFTSHMAFADKFTTILLDMEDFEKQTFDRMAHGYVLDENDAELVGFVTTGERNGGEFTRYELSMLDGRQFEWKLRYGSPSCEFLLHGDLLYIANYHPIATGSSLHCFDLKAGKMKWNADVLQVNASHSEYENRVTLSMYEGKVVMEGQESYGSYLQVFEGESGKRMADFGILDLGK